MSFVTHMTQYTVAMAIKVTQATVQLFQGYPHARLSCDTQATVITVSNKQ